MEQSYLKTRLAELGITDKENTIELSYTNRSNDTDYKAKKQIFTADKSDNIEILYYDIFGNAIEYPAPKTEAKDYFNRYIEYSTSAGNNLKTEKHDNNKYMSPKGQPKISKFLRQNRQNFCIKI